MLTACPFRSIGVGTTITRTRLAFFLLQLLPSSTFVVAGIKYPSFPSIVNVALLPQLSRRNILTGTAAALSTSMSTPSPSPPAVRWGIVGLGDVTSKKSGPPFYKCRGSRLVAVMRRTPGRAAEWVKAQKMPGDGDGGCVGYDNLRDFVDHPGGIDAVYVATRPGTHLEICRDVIERITAGGASGSATIKALYVEKPVGRCGAETEEIVKLAGRNNIRLYTAYISRAYERTQCVRKLLQDGAVGDKVTDITYRLVGTGGARGMDSASLELPWRLQAKQSGGGLIVDVGCHVLDRIDYLCGPLVEVAGTAENRNSPFQDVEDYVEINATIGRMESNGNYWEGGTCSSEGAKVSCTWDFSGTQPGEVDELIIAGPAGSIRMVAMSPSLPISVCDSGGQVARTFSFEAQEHTAQNMIQAVTDDLRGLTGDMRMLSKGDNAARTSKVIDEALKGYYGNREIGFWDEEPSSNWPGRRRNNVKAS